MARDTKLPERTYLGHKELDALARMHTELLSEVWILKDRVMLLEYLLGEAGIVTDDALDTLEIPAALADKINAARDAFVQRVVGAGHRQSLDLDAIKKT